MRDVARGWLVAGLTVAAALILGAPYIGQLRNVIRDFVGQRFALFMAIVVGGAATIAVVAALVRIRDRRWMRYRALVAAVAIAAIYSWVSRTGNPEVDAVERFHFIEYGLISVLFYRAWRPSGDGSLFLMPLLLGLAIGTLEEWLQWFIPVRVGEFRDVLLNTCAIGCGLLFSIGLDPPEQVTLRLTPASRRRAARLAAATVVLFGLFFHFVHLGYEIKDPQAGVFRSRYTDSELAALSAERAQRWRTNPPLTWRRLSREDQYFSEGVAHVQRRNQAWQEGNVLGSLHENIILEKYYAPVLDAPSYVSAQGFRWPAEQLAAAEASQRGPGFMIYVSDANVYPILIWSKWAFWLVVALLVVVILRMVPAARRG